ncbi:JAB domain-containing protein [Virgibacillus sp. Bac330]|uniref:JAB domain-containing protein n=1 Tax=Virgibacillus sp. Bac330 TaxID=2419841 RepID=UPI0013CEC321|nr:JAB domain-containing protein [Virgibacillus sp. Bac330]
MNNLYEYFGCSSKEELYQKVTKGDDSVRSLVDFIDFSKGQMNSKEKAITSPQDFIEFVAKSKMPSQSETTLVFCSTKNKPLYLTRYQKHDQIDLKRVLKEGLNAGGVSLFYLSNDTMSTDNEVEMGNYFKTFGIDVIDGFSYNEISDTITSNREMIPYRLSKYAPPISEVAERDGGRGTAYEMKNAITTFHGFDEFSSFFANQEIVGSNLLKDNAKVKKSLKVGYQYDWQESFGIIACDSDYKVVFVNELFKGSPNASIVDRKVFTKALLSKDDVSKIAVFHNHPSGIPEPSPEDKQITKGLKEVSEKLNIQFLDHFIVGKESVYSFAKYIPEYVCRNKDYSSFVQKQAKIKRGKQMAFELEL